MAWSDRFHYDKYLYVHPAATVFAARVNQASFTYPLAEVTFDTVTVGAWTDIEYGMTVLFGSTSGGDDLGRQRVRAIGDATTLKIGWSSRGVRDGEVNLADDAYITVLNDWRAWTRNPRIDANGALFKDYELTISAGINSPPVANAGVGVLQFVDDGTSVITVDFDGTDSFTTAPGATITAYSWDFVDGTPGSAATATVNNVTFPLGFRWVTLTITDSNAVQHACRVPVAALGETLTEADYSGATITATSEFGSSAANAFDNDLFTWWTTAEGVDQATLQIQFPTSKTIAQYEVNVSNLNPLAPVAWTLEGSYDGATYAVLDTQSGQTWYTPSARTYTISAPGAYSYYRIVITESRTGFSPAQTGITELSLYERTRNYIKNFEVTSQTLTRNGQTISFNIFESLPATTYYDGCLVMYGEDEYYNDVKGSLAGPSGRENVKFVGWHDTDTASLVASDTTYTTSLELSCVDIAGRMRQLPAFPQAVLRDSTPATWLDLEAANTDRYVHYLLHWHSTVLDIAPFVWSGTGETYALPRFQSPGQNLWEQVYFRAASIAYELTVSMRGTLAMIPDPQLQDSADRTSTVIVDIDPSDWTSIEYTHTRSPRTYWLWGNAVVGSTKDANDPTWVAQGVYCVAPGEAPGQGESEQTQGEQLVNPTTPQTELNAREGHRYAARLNPPQTYFEIALTHPGDVGIDPALMEWVRLTIPSDLAARRGLTFTDERFLPFEVDVVHNNITQTKEYFLRAEREVVGTPAATVIPETGSVLPDTPDIDEWPYIWKDEPGLFRGATNIAAFTSDSVLHTTTTFNIPEASGGPQWTATDLTGLSPALSGVYMQMVGDPFSPLYLGTGTTVNGWILTRTGIYGIADVFGVSGGPTLTLQHTHAVAAGANATGFLATGIGVQNYVTAVIYYGTATGTVAISTTDGSTWAESTITAHYDTDETYPTWAFVSSFVPGTAWVPAFTSTGAFPTASLYTTANYGATWAADAVYSVDFNHCLGQCFHIPWHDNASQLLAYYGKRTASPTAWSNTFYRLEADGTSTDITPSNAYFGMFPLSWWSFGVCPIDRRRLLAFMSEERNPSTSDAYAIFSSVNGGDSWTQVTSYGSATGPLYFAIGGNDPNIVYGWGTGPSIIYSEDFMVTSDDRTGDMTGAALIVNILGG